MLNHWPCHFKFDDKIFCEGRSIAEALKYNTIQTRLSCIQLYWVNLGEDKSHFLTSVENDQPKIKWNF